LIEGLPGGGKTTAIKSITNKFNCYVLIEDICNPCQYIKNYRIDWTWVVLAESMKSQLANRANGIGIIERGYLSLLAFHAAEDILMGTSHCQAIAVNLLASQAGGFFTPPAATIVMDLDPETSIQRQCQTRMNEWRDPIRLAIIKEFYKVYSELPLFTEQYRFIDANGDQRKTYQTIEKNINEIKIN
jgi:thymidylate kinase